MDRQSDNPRFKQEMDNYIMGHYGEDQFRGEDDKQSLTFTFDTYIPREKADRLAEGLFLFLKELWGVTTVVSYTVKDENEAEDDKETGTA